MKDSIRIEALAIIHSFPRRIQNDLVDLLHYCILSEDERAFAFCVGRLRGFVDGMSDCGFLLGNQREILLQYFDGVLCSRKENAKTRVVENVSYKTDACNKIIGISLGVPDYE